MRKQRNLNGEGGLSEAGYHYHTIGGERVFTHRAVAEKAVGRKLPAEVVVHHVDHDRGNNAPSNLVVCQDASYHRLIHYRERALSESGDANKKQCKFCKTWDHPQNVYYNPAAQTFWHRKCRQEHRRAQ